MQSPSGGLSGKVETPPTERLVGSNSRTFHVEHAASIYSIMVPFMQIAGCSTWNIPSCSTLDQRVRSLAVEPPGEPVRAVGYQLHRPVPGQAGVPTTPVLQA